MKNYKSYLLLVLVISMTIALPVISYQLEETQLIGFLPRSIAKHFLYQPLTMGIAIILLIVLRLTREEVFKTYFRKGVTSASILPEPYVGINPKPGDTWSKAGKEWALVVSLVTAVVIYSQVSFQTHPSLSSILMASPYIVVFALSNSLVEEIITRVGVVVALDGILPPKTIAILSGIIFGSVHFFGDPGGVVGVLVAGFLGWLLAKSILETKGIFWAWLIHFLQDVIILAALFTK